MVVKHTNKAFTLIELLVVIVIIGILSTISTATFTGYKEKANDTKQIVFATQLERAIKNQSIFNQNTHETDSLTHNLGLFQSDILEGITTELFGSSASPSNDICPKILLAEQSFQDPDGDICILTHTDTQSSLSNNNPGLSIFGSETCIQAFTTYSGPETITRSDFECKDFVGGFYSSFSKNKFQRIYDTYFSSLYGDALTPSRNAQFFQPTQTYSFKNGGIIEYLK